MTVTILTRIYIQENGDLVVTDLWDEIREMLEGPAEVASEGEGEGDAVGKGL